MNGSWLPDVHPLHVGANHYTEVKNLRPSSSGYETVEGYSKINTTTTATPVNTHHFKKDGETHVIAKINSSGTYYLYDNTTAIPSQGDFSATPLYTVGSGLGSFANGPQGTMFYADGQYSLVTGGDEMRPESFFVGDDLDTLRDFTENITNDLTSKIANIGAGGNDSSTVLLLHADGADATTTFTDSGATTHTVTANGDAQIDTAYYKFGGASGIFDGTGDYLSIPDHADWNYGSGEVTIDGQVRFNVVTGQHCLYSQSSGVNYVVLIQDHDASLLSFYAMSASVSVARKTATWAPVAGTWYHWAVIRGWGGGANSWAMTINGTAIATWTDSGTLPDVAAVVRIGSHDPTTVIDSGENGHAFSVTGNVTASTTYKKFGNGSLYFDGTGDKLSSIYDSDFDSLSGDPVTIELWAKHTDHAGSEVYLEQYVGSGNYWTLNHLHGTGIQFRVVSGGTDYQTLTGGEITDTDEHHILVVSAGSGVWGLYKDGVQVAYYSGSEVSPTFNAPLTVGDFSLSTSPFDGYMDEIRIYKGNPYGASPDVGLTDTITVPTAAHTSDSSTVLLLHGDTYDFNGWIDEYRVSKGVARWTINFTSPQGAYYDKTDFFYVGSPLKLNGIKIYIETANTETSTMSGSVSVGSAWSTLALTDNTSSGGISLAQTGTVTFSYNEDAKPIYINGAVLYVYRFAISAGGASVYKVTASAPLQPIRDVWNQSPRTCTSFQVYKNASTNFSDYTFQVEAKDSSEASVYAAEIGGMVAADYFEIFFDDRTMGINFSMLSSLVNAVDAQITDVKYWDGGAYTSVGYFVDKTLDAAADSSFAKSGVLWWNPPTDDQEKPQEKFGIRGYGYKITIDGAGLTANTSIDYATGITAPLDMSGYDRVGVYNGRVMLIDGNRVDYSQTNTPWVFNGVDSSDGGRLPLYFGDDNPITATGSIYNRYGSNIYELWVATKDNSTFILTGSQPYPQYDDAFTIKTVSESIGCHAPMTMVSSVAETGEGLDMSFLSWLDYSGPIIFNGAEPKKLAGVETFFDQTDSVYINYSYINKSVSYIDTINNQINFLFPTNANTANSKWIVYDIKYKKWFEKVPPNYLLTATSVTDTNGARYNYGFISAGNMMRLDNGATWDSTAIAQNIKTGYFSPPVEDEFGLWTRSEIRGLKLLSGKITENQDVTVTIYNDGVLSSNSLTVALDASGIISKNNINGGNLAEQADYFQVNFAASNSSDKWNPLAWAYKAIKIREP